MHFTPLLAVGSLLLPSVAAQGFNPYPICAVDCTRDSLPGSPCTSIADFECICTNQEFQRALNECVQAECTPEEATRGLAYGIQQCSQNGFTVSTGVVSGSASSTGSRSSTSTVSRSSTTSTSSRSSTRTLSVALGTSTLFTPDPSTRFTVGGGFGTTGESGISLTAGSTGASGTVGTSAAAGASPTGAGARPEAQKLYVAGGVVMAVAGGFAAFF